MILTYENDIGKIAMGGGAHPLWRIATIDGLGVPPKNYNTAAYVGQDGVKTLSTAATSRTITISGAIVNNNGHADRELTRAAKILNQPGILKLQIGNKRRKAMCKISSFDYDLPRSPLKKFTLQLIADDPNFFDWANTTIAVFKRVDHITDGFTLPMVFTTRTNEVNILNLGDIKSAPVFYITNAAGTGGGTSDIGYLIENLTPDPPLHLHLKTECVPGEVIKIDIGSRTITSSVRGSIINKISTDTFLSAFWLAVGNNDIKLTNYNLSESISAVCEYSNRYVEAVY